MCLKMRQAAVQLEKMRTKWVDDSRMEEAKQESAMALMSQKVNKVRAAQKAVDELKSRAALAASVSLWLSKLPDPVPEDPKVEEAPG